MLSSLENVVELGIGVHGDLSGCSRNSCKGLRTVLVAFAGHNMHPELFSVLELFL